MDGAAFGAGAASCIRVCFATEEAVLDEACRRLRLFCEGLAAAPDAQRTV